LCAMAEFEKMKIIFSKYDVDHSGEISPQELTDVLMKLNSAFSVEDCQTLFASIDTDKDGSIQWSEWLDWLQAEEGEYVGAKAGVMLTKGKSEAASADTIDAAKRAKLRGKFAQLDKDGNGTLDFQEVYNFLHKRYPDMNVPDLRFLYNCADKSNDGALDFYELLDMLVTIPAHKQAAGAPSVAPESFMGSVMFRDDEQDMMEEAMRKYERDQKEMASIANDLVGELAKLEDEEKRHKVFRDAHAKAMQKHYATTGQLRK